MGGVNEAQNRRLPPPRGSETLRLTLLGPMTVSRDGVPVPIPSRRARALLGYLALREGVEVPRAVLAGLLWGERAESQARASLRQALSELRGALGAAAISGGNDAAGLRAGVAWIDATEVEALARAGDPEGLREAAALVGGELMEGLALAEPGFEHWLAGERERFRMTAAGIHARLMDAAERRGALAEALGHGQRLLALDPLQEHVHRALMRLFAAQGRHDAALAQYERCRAELLQHLGVRPDGETEALARTTGPAAARRYRCRRRCPVPSRTRPIGPRWRCCRSPTSAATPSSNTLPTASRRTSSRNCRATDPS